VSSFPAICSTAVNLTALLLTLLFVELNCWVSAHAASKRFNKLKTILNNGYLGSRFDEERSEMRYVMRIAEFSESSNL
jgi:hypothetical protein